MNKEYFDNLSEEDQKVVFDEMCELYNLVCNYPIDINDLTIFTKWHKRTGKWGKELKDLLIGICPSEELNQSLNKEELNYLFECSKKTLKLVSFWNKLIRINIKSIV